MARIFLLALLAHAVVVAGGVTATYFLLKPHFGGGGAMSAEVRTTPVEYDFYPVERLIVSLRSDGRERYFVLDLMLLAQTTGQQRDFARIEPLVRNAVIGYLSGYQYEDLRSLQLAELQNRLERVLFDDFRRKQVAAPFEQVLISKLLVQ